MKASLKNKKILVVAPHPDDEAICAGGLIMLAKQNSGFVHVLFGAIGYSRQFQTQKTEAKTRLVELKNAAKYAGYTYDIMYQGQEFMRLDTVSQKDLIERIEDTSHKFNPEIVVIPDRKSFDQDHRALSTACLTAFRPIPSKLRNQPKLILECEEPYDWPEENRISPNFFFDISNVFDKKIRLLEKHETQLREDPFPRSPENLQRLAGYRGCEIGTKYAEGYKLLRGQML